MHNLDGRGPWVPPVADKIAPGVTVEGPARGDGARRPPDPVAREQQERLRRIREMFQTGLFAGVALYFAVTWVAPQYAPQWHTPGLVLSGVLVGGSLIGMIVSASRLGRLEQVHAEAEGPEALAAYYRDKRDSARWYAVVGVLMLFVAGFSPALGAGGVLMVGYGATAYLYWNRKAKQAYDPWQDDELDAWEEEQFGRP